MEKSVRNWVNHMKISRSKCNVFRIDLWSHSAALQVTNPMQTEILVIKLWACNKATHRYTLLSVFQFKWTPAATFSAEAKLSRPLTRLRIWYGAPETRPLSKNTRFCHCSYMYARSQPFIHRLRVAFFEYASRWSKDWLMDRWMNEWMYLWKGMYGGEWKDGYMGSRVPMKIKLCKLFAGTP